MSLRGSFRLIFFLYFDQWSHADHHAEKGKIIALIQGEFDIFIYVALSFLFFEECDKCQS